MNFWLIEGSGDYLPDRGFSHGLGVFETMLVVDGLALNADAHRLRMAAGCDRLKIPVPDWEKVLAVIFREAESVDSPRARARVMRTAGHGQLASLEGTDARTVLSMQPCPEAPVSLRVATAPWIRDERSPLAGIKCTSYADYLMALNFAKEHAGVDELLFANSKGDWCEGTTSNGFAVLEGRLSTPSLDAGCLPGTMRAQVLIWAKEFGIEVEERAIPMGELGSASEMFLTSAIRGVVPVVELDGVPRAVGELTARLREVSRSWAGLEGGK